MDFSELEIIPDYQDVFEDEKQKVLVTIKNNSENKAFKGDIYVRMYENKKQVGSDTIFIDDRITPQAEISAILWAKGSPDNIKYEVSGEWLEAEQKKIGTDIKYEIIHEVQNGGMKSYYIKINDYSDEKAKELFEVFKDSYTKDSLMKLRIVFYDNTFNEKNGKTPDDLGKKEIWYDFTSKEYS